MSITIEQVPLWARDERNNWHIVVNGERRGPHSMTWVRTPHSLVSWMYVRKTMPASRICRECREALKTLNPKAAAAGEKAE